MPVWRCAEAVTALVVVLLVTIAPGVSDAAAATDDVEAPTTATPAGSFDGVDYVQYDGVFAGHTSTGAFQVPYRITAPVDLDDGNGAVVVEPPHFATGLGTLAFQLGRAFPARTRVHPCRRRLQHDVVWSRLGPAHPRPHCSGHLHRGRRRRRQRPNRRRDRR